MLSGKGTDMDVRRPITISAVFTISILLSACADTIGRETVNGVNVPSAACEPSAVPDRFIVRWKDGSISVKTAEDTATLEREFIEPNREDIDFVEHDFKVSIRVPSSNETVESYARPPADIDWGQVDVGAYEAWKIAQGEGITVAVIDSGVDPYHPQLIDRIAINTGEIPDDGIDNDNNGFIDDYLGFDFHKYSIGKGGSGNIRDPLGHGTHVAGIILAEHTPNGLMKGIAPKAKLIPLNFMGPDETGYIGDAIFAIEYAVRRGARVINASWGGPSCSLALRQKIAALESLGVLFVAAAGNGDPYTGIGYNLDFRADYPAAFGLPGQLTVGATNIYGRMTGFSNYSYNLVHLMAPGWQIMSTFPTGGKARCSGYSPAPGYCYMSGTSMATPFVAGAAALLWSYRPQATVSEIRTAIMKGVTPGEYQAVSRGRLNIRRALEEI